MGGELSLLTNFYNHTRPGENYSWSKKLMETYNSYILFKKAGDTYLFLLYQKR